VRRFFCFTFSVRGKSQLSDDQAWPSGNSWCNNENHDFSWI